VSPDSVTPGYLGSRPSRRVGATVATMPTSSDTNSTESLQGILGELSAAGYRANFGARPGASIHCSSCGIARPASEWDNHEIRRLEGMSDPADMIAVVALRCPSCRVRGTVVLSYGPEASLDDAEVLIGLEQPSGDRGDSIGAGRSTSARRFGVVLALASGVGLVVRRLVRRRR